MPLIINNAFTQDTYAMRSDRLAYLTGHLDDYQSELDLPINLHTWAVGDNTATPPIKSAFKAWSDAHVAADIEKGEMDDAYAQFHASRADVEDTYQRIKDLYYALISDYGGGNDIPEELGIVGRSPENYSILVDRVNQMKDVNDRLIAASDPRALPATMIDGLQTDAQASWDLRQTAILEKSESVNSHKALTELYDEDAEKLRLVYNWCVVMWDKYDPRLISIGFAPAQQHGGGQPDAPTNLTFEFVQPTLTLTWDAVDDATSYQLAYSDDNKEWEELYSGDELIFAYDPPLGIQRFYRVRARNANGFGDWSNTVVFEPPAV